MLFLIIILFVVLVFSLVSSYYIFKEGKSERRESKNSKRDENEMAGLKKQAYKVFSLGLILCILSLVILTVIIWLLLMI